MCLGLSWLSCNLNPLCLVHLLLALVCTKKLLSFDLALFRFEADLKVSIPTSYATCELYVAKNLDLAKCIGCLQDKNDKLCEVLSWLSPPIVTPLPPHSMAVGCAPPCACDLSSSLVVLGEWPSPCRS
jgi:hypothetical protein